MKPWLSPPLKKQALPLKEDDSSRFLPWILAAMIFLLSLALAFCLLSGSALQQWQAALSQSASVQVPAPSRGEPRALSIEDRVKKIQEILQSTPGITQVAPVDPAQSRALLDQWLGEGAALQELPIPRLIDISWKDGLVPDLQSLRAELEKAVPGTQLDSHEIWLKEIMRFGELAILTMYAVSGLILLSSLAIVAFATKSGLLAHHRTIDLLHIMGAADGFIAAKFARNVFWLALKGGFFGVLCAALFLMALAWAFSPIAAELMPLWRWQAWHNALFFLLPVLMAWFAMMTAAMTVTRKLQRVI